MTVKDNLEEAKAVALEKVSEAWDSAAKARLFHPPKGTGILDMLQEKLISRKLLVFATSTALMWYGLDSNTWGMIAMCYIGGQSAIDFAKVWRG